MAKKRNAATADSYLEGLQTDYSNTQSEFEKNLLFIATGVLGGSFAFIEKLVDLKSANFKILLTQGWIFIGIAIFLAFISQFVNTLFQYLAISTYGEEDTPQQERLRILSAVFSFGSSLVAIVLILIGSLNIINFVRVNI